MHGYIFVIRTDSVQSVTFPRPMTIFIMYKITPLFETTGRRDEDCRTGTITICYTIPICLFLLFNLAHPSRNLVMSAKSLLVT